jgi:hypothetical protein
MAEDNEHVQKLMKARDREVAQRRHLADTLAQQHGGGHVDNTRAAFINVQNTIDAIERAIGHEKMLAGPVIPS